LILKNQLKIRKGNILNNVTEHTVTGLILKNQLKIRKGNILNNVTVIYY